MFNEIQRRSVLRVLGLAGGASLLPSLLPKGAQAATAPKRFLWFFTYHGTLSQHWVPRTGSETSFELHDLLAPLAPHKKDLLLLDGLDMKDRQHKGYQGQGNAHQQGHNSSVAGVNPVSSDLAGGPSLDQLIAKANAGKTKFASIELGVPSEGSGTFPGYARISYSGPGQKLPNESDPRKVWNRVFNGFTPPAAGPTTIAPAPVDNTGKRQKSILDFVGAEIKAVGPKLSVSDRSKLDAHASVLRDLEVRLAIGAPGGGTANSGAGAGCSAYAMPAPMGWSATVDAFAKMSAMLFACDLTRVISLPVCNPENSASGYTQGAFGTADLHDLAHKTSKGASLAGDPGAVAMAVKWHLNSTNVMLKLLDALAATPDVDGKRLLDNTAVLWSGEIANGGHATDDCKWLLAGGAGGAIRTGRWLKCNGAPHQNMYVSLGQAMGLDITTFGNPETCTGKLAGF